jgi:hypothetical protein
MGRKIVKTLGWGMLLLTVGLSAAKPGSAEEKTKYPAMAPLEQYLMERDAEIALAQSAAPPAISRDAEVWVLGRNGYELAVKGKNGFACLVERAWASGFDEAEFWNPKLRGAICFNPAAAQSVVPPYLERTKMVLAGQSKAQMMEAIKAAFEKKEMSAPAPGSMCYMLSRDAYLSDSDPHWHPHLMFFVPSTDAAAWGAGLPGSPILVGQDQSNHTTVFLVPVSIWSDGSAAPPYHPH